MKRDTSFTRYLPLRRNLGTSLFDFTLCALIGLVVALGCYAGLGHIHP